MSDNDAGASGDDAGERGSDISAADERALRAMFAALVEGAEPSEQSPLDVQRLALQAQRSARDRRSQRIRYTRNVLIAAVLVGVVALVVPQLASTSTNSAASSSGSAAAPAAGSQGSETFAAGAAAGGTAPMRAGATGDRSRTEERSAAAASSAAAIGSAAAPSVSSSSGAAAAPAASAAAGSGGSDAGTSASSGAASSGAASASSSAASSAPLSSSALPPGEASSSGACPAVSAIALADVRAALPTDYRDARVTSECGRLQFAGSGSRPGVSLLVSRSQPGSCAQGATPPCRAIPGQPGAYFDDHTSLAVVIVYGRGLAVTVTTEVGGPSRSQLLAVARVLLRSVG